MAKVRVIAHFMHEVEEEAAFAALSNSEGTEAFVFGEIDSAQIPALEAKGLIVEQLSDPVMPRVHELMDPRRRRMAAERDRAFVEPVVDLSQPLVYVLQLKGPALPTWRQQMADHGVTLIEALGQNQFTAKLDQDQANAARRMPFVVTVRPFSSRDAAPPLPPKATAGSAPNDFTRMQTFDIRLHRASDSGKVQDWLKSHNIPISGASGRKLRVFLAESSLEIAEIRSLPEVHSMDEYIPPKLHNDRARVLIGVDRSGNPGGTRLPQKGQGQIVGIADTGIDDQHPDLQGRVQAVALGRLNDSSDPHGHGTHVAGTVAGNGTASAQTICGVAPEANIFFQSVMDARGELGGLPLDLNTLFDEAYVAGARIHNNSWGSATESRYTFNSIEVDEFIHGHPDMLIIISAGNEGTAALTINSQAGFVDWLTIGSPASSKNALTVGASQSDRTTGGLSTLSYGQAWPNDFPDLPVRDESISGNIESMAAFSSRGPCDDRRIKPDLVAPGTDILSTKSSRAPLRNFWGSFGQHQGKYAYMGGTSMAAPVVAGCAALVREYYVKTMTHEPSAALIKATLINSTRWLTANSAKADFADMPNFHQGFGCIDMQHAYPNPDEPLLQLRFLDTWKDAARQFQFTGQRHRYLITVGDRCELRFCLAWTDLPARSLQNNLNLFVQHNVANGQKWIGNEQLPMSLRIPDPDNNVEVIRIVNPQPGDYLIQLTARNLLSSKQDFALVITGDLPSNINDFGP